MKIKKEYNKVDAIEDVARRLIKTVQEEFKKNGSPYDFEGIIKKMEVKNG